jgi:hypothetical protein
MIDTSLFPYETFTVRLEIPQENRIAWFSDDYNLQKYLSRVKLKPKDIKVLYKNEKPTGTSKTNTKKLQQRVAPSSDGSANRPRRNTKDLDAAGTVNRSRKSKPKSK